ncbi:PKHD1L1 [Branchiostoma lanceolatum]|uniref:peptidylprolyl isomerase n=1 Tax=Branchiostoma lanceolatum TaxID=7740 RepID=A0A8J9YN76_BRALA|nr:PKHD1L1 [Branchiostoma lanceolatum]
MYIKKGFPEDQYAGNKVFLISKDGTRSVECDVEKQQSTGHSIVCDTRPAPEGEYYVRLFENEVQLPLEAHCDSPDDELCRFEYEDGRTPYIESITPSSGPPQTVVDIRGRIFTSKYQSTIGGEGATIERYGIQLDNGGTSNWGNLKCQVKNKFIGSHNGSFVISGNHGESQNKKENIKVDKEMNLYSFQTHAEVLGVSPSGGSEEGGTRITIRGRFFNYTMGRTPPRVLVGGQPCEVVGTPTFDTIKCITPAVPENLPAAWPGGRGAKIEQWNNTNPWAFDQVTNYTSDMPGYWVRPPPEGFWWDESVMESYVTRMSSFFVPSATGQWQFYIKSDDRSNLYMSPDEDPGKRVKVAHCNQYRPYFTTKLEQRTDKMWLEKGKRYYMEATQHEGVGGANFYLAARYFDTAYTAGQTKYAWMEEQEIQTSSTTRNEVQIVTLSSWSTASARDEVQRVTIPSGESFKLTMLGATTGLLNTDSSANAIESALNGLPSIAPDRVSVTKSGNVQYTVTFKSDQGTFPLLEVELASGASVVRITEGKPKLAKFTLEFGGAYSDPIANDADGPTVRAAVLSMLSTRCISAITSPSNSITKFYRDYENPPTSWQQGTRVPGDVGCGRWALKRPHWLYHPYFNGGDVPLQTYRYTCFAYKGGPSFSPRIQLKVRFNENGGTRVHWTYPDVGLLNDKQWHYTCVNLYDLMATQYPSGSGFIMQGLLLFQAHLTPKDEEEDYFVDDLYIGRTALVNNVEDVLSQRAPGPDLDGNLIEDVLVSKTEEESVYNITFVPYKCGHDFPLMGVRSATTSGNRNRKTYTFPSTGTSSQILIEREWGATPPITGTMDISYKGVTLSGVPSDISASELQAQLMTLGTGDISVERDGSCSGYKWTVDWLLSGGDKPAFEVLGSGLIGEDAVVEVTESRDGGLFMYPLGGDYTETVHDEPQVQVFVNNIPSSCVGDCTFEWSDDATPTITSLSPTSGSASTSRRRKKRSASTVVTITGSGFSTNTSLNSVDIGGVACVVATATAEEITCSVQEGAGGTHVVQVTVDGKGRAKHVNETFRFTYTAEISGITPTSGSLGGGTTLNITGHGFGVDYIPKIDGQPCEITLRMYSVISCTTPARSSAGTVAVTVYQGADLNTTLTSPTSFTYDSSRTPIITALNNTVANVEGGTVIAISGTAFGEEAASDDAVMIGEMAGEILAYSDTAVSVRLPAQATGSYPLRLLVDGNGFADTSTNSIPDIEYRLTVTNVYPDQGSILGGTRVLIKGEGFSETAASNVVMFGDVPCEVESADATLIVCVTGTAAQTHVITNDGTHPDYGAGYAWSETRVTVNAGDKVRWEWEAPDLAQGVGYSVQQTTSASSTEYDGTGFYSGPKTAKGVFEHTFTTSGGFSYSSAAVDSSNRIFMKGFVQVNPLEDHNREENLKLKVAGFEANYDVDSAAADPTDTRSCAGTVTSITSCTDAAPTSNSSADGFPFDFWSCSTPKITSISRNNGTVHDAITISGSGFGTNICENEVTIGGYAADCVAQEGGDTLLCNANPHDDDMDDPMPIGTYHPIAISVNNRGNGLTEITRTQDRSFVLLSSMDTVSPAEGSLAGGTRVVITGTGFSSSTSVTVAGQACNIISVTYTRIVCKTGAHQSRKRSTNHAGQVTISQTINGASIQVACSSNCAYTYAVSATPTVTAVAPTQVSGALNELRINGTLFGTEASNVTITVGSEECNITHIEDDFILCDLEAVEVGDNAFELHIDGKGNADSSVSTIESLAEINSFTPTNGSTQGGMTFTITGNGFVDGDTTIMFGSLACPITEISLLQVKCTVPARAEGVVNVVTTSNDVQYPVKQFEYLEDQTPVVDSIDPSVGSTGNTITLTGSKFGTDTSDISVTIDNAGCGVSSLTDTEIQCSVGSHSAGSYPVVVQSESKGYAISNVNFTYQLRLDSVSPVEGSFGGGQELTVTGAGFDPEVTEVTVCNRACVLKGQPVPSSLTCEVPSNPDSSQSTKACPVRVSVNSEADEEASGFTYRSDRTPRVTGVSPVRGGTAGGTTVTITGTGFRPTENVVTIAGSACIIQSESTVQIVCVTEAHNGTAKSKVRVEVGDQGVALQDAADFWYIDVWSSPYTWGGGPLPEAGDLVAVPKGMTLLLDVTTPVLKVLLIQGGELIFDEKDIELKAENILITGGGLLQVGTEEEPFQHKGIITMYGHVRSTELPLYGAKTLAVREGRLELHGRPTPVTWTRLSETATVGATTLNLKDSVDWNVGDSVVIATTGNRHSQAQNEQREIAAISEDGRTLTLTEGLEFEHLSVMSTFTAGGESVTVAAEAEVGLLTHNVVVRGNNNEEWNTEIEACEEGFDTGEFTTQTCFQGRFGDEIGSDQFGAQVMLHAPRKDEDLVAGHLSYVEFTNSGQAFRLGRYAIHWHINGVMRGSYVRGCSIHKSFNRAINIHDTHEMLIEHNVFYNIMGGAMFLEDGVETGNIFQYNLGVFVISSTSLLNDDITPAAYWVTNPNNTHRHNVAAGGTHFGFWYRMHTHPDGPSYDPNIWPAHVPLGEFYNNTVHSQGWFGIWIFEDYNPTDNSKPDGEPLPADFRGLTAWNNEKAAEWIHCGAIRFSDSVVFNNEKAGFEAKFLLNQYANWGDAMYKDSWVIASVPALASTASTDCTKKGIIMPYGHRLTISGLKFVNFNQPSCVAIGITSIDGTCGEWCGGFTYKFDNILWGNSPNRGLFRWVHDGVYYDTDGSLTGTANAKIVPTNDALPPECTASPEFSTKPNSHPASLCPPGVDFVRFAWKDALPSNLEYKDVSFTTQWGKAVGYFIDKRMTHKPGWMVLLQTKETHIMEFEEGGHITNISYTGAFSELANDQWIRISHNFTQKPDRFQVIPGVMTNVSSRPVSADSNNGDWYFDTNNKRFTYIMSGKDATNSPATRTVQLKVFRCYYAQCIPPPDPNTLPPARERPEDFDVWSNPESWKDTEEGWGGNYGNGAYGLPQDGDDVKIPGGQWMVVDTALPIMHKLWIYGVLEFDDGPDKDFTLTATYIVVQGGRLIIGWEDNPYQGQAKIVLQGNHLTPDMPFPSVNAGSKVLACFGGCDLHGKNRNYPFSKLAQPAEVGSTQLVVADPVDWVAGDEIVITTTSYDPWETEIFKIRAVSDKTITLNGSLAHHHLGATYTLEDETTYTMAAEVGLLTRNVKIIGDDGGKLFQESFGARLMVSKFADESKEYIGYARVTNTEFYRTGQEGWTDFFDARYSIAYMDTGTVDSIRPSYVRKNAFHNCFSVAVGVFGATGIEVDDNVIHHTVGQGINVWGTNNKIRNNLVALNIWTGDYNGRTEEENVDIDASIEVHNGRGIVLQGNRVAGSEKAGYHIDGEPCAGNTADAWSDNEVHGALIGVWALEDCFPPCVKVRGFYVWKAFDFGIYFQSKCNLELEGNTIADSRLGLFHMVIGPSALAHQVVDNYVKMEDSLFIGRSEAFDCDRDQPQLNPNPKPKYIRYPSHGRSFSTPSGGMVGTQLGMFSTGNNGATTHPFAGEMSYPTLSGYFWMSDVKFARYGTACGREDVAIMTNPAQEDATFPTYVSGLSWPGSQENNKIYYDRPGVGKVNPSDCVDMACDAKLVAIIIDSDGSALGTPGTVVPEQEWEWQPEGVSNWGGNKRYGIGDYRIPTAALAGPDGSKLSAADVAPMKGVLRDDSCTYKSSWQAYECHNIDYQMLIIESMDPDTETRRLSPVAVMSGGAVSLYNGPQDHGWCVGYTCQKRISTFYAIVYSDRHHNIYLTGVNPQKLRLHLRLRDGEDKAIRVAIFYSNPQRLDVYRGTSYVMPTNGENNEEGQLILNAPTSQGQYIPAMNAASGSNYFDDDTKMLYITIRGDTPIDIVTMPVLKVSFGMPAITVDDFFETNLINNLASFLGIPANKIRIVNVVREDSRRRKRAEGSMTVEIEITEPPAQESSSSEDTTEEARQDLQQASSLIVDSTQLGTISDEIGIEVQSLAVVEPLPSANSSDWEDVAEEAESGVSPAATAIQIPSRIALHTQPGPRGEGAAFPTQPALQVFDGSGNLVKTLGASSNPWEVQARIRSGTGTDSRARTTGNSIVFKDGWANFTDLAITHSGEGYILDFVIVKPASASRFNTSSVAVDVEERRLSARVIGTDAMLEVDEAFTLSVAITDAFTNEDVQDIAWKGHTWQCAVELDPISTQDGGAQSATFAGTKTVTFDPATGRATFSDLSLDKYNRYHLRFHVTSTPGDHDFWINASPVTVYPANHTSPVIEESSHVTLTFDGSYPDAVVGKEDYLETTLWQEVVGERFDVLVLNFTFTEGSVITDFDVKGTNEGVNATLMDLYDKVKGGMTLDIGGSTLTARKNMVVDGSDYYGADGVPPAAPPSAFPVVPVVVVIVLLLLIILAAAAFYFYRKKRQLQVARVRNKVADDVPLKPSPSSSRAGGSADAESGLGSTNPSYANVKDSDEALPPVSPKRSSGNMPINPQPVLPPMNKGHTQVTPIGSRNSSPLPEVNVTALCKKYQEPDANGCILLDVVAQGHDSRFFKLGQHNVKVSASLKDLRKELKTAFPRLQTGQFVYLNATMTDRIPKKREEFLYMRDMGNGPIIVRLN